MRESVFILSFIQHCSYMKLTSFCCLTNIYWSNSKVTPISYDYIMEYMINIPVNTDRILSIESTSGFNDGWGLLYLQTSEKAVTRRKPSPYRWTAAATLRVDPENTAESDPSFAAVELVPYSPSLQTDRRFHCSLRVKGWKQCHVPSAHQQTLTSHQPVVYGLGQAIRSIRIVYP